MLITAVEGLPYPTSADAALIPHHLAATGLAMDVLENGWDAVFNGFRRPPAFLSRMSADSNTNGPAPGGFNMNWNTVVYENPAGQMCVVPSSGISLTAFQQPPGDGAAWWFFGCAITLTLGGAITVNAINRLTVYAAYPTYSNAPNGFRALTPGPAPAQVTVAAPPNPTGPLIAEAPETNNGGESLVVVGVLKLFGGAAVIPQFLHFDQGAASVRTVKAGGSAFWGFRLGPA